MSKFYIVIFLFGMALFHHTTAFAASLMVGGNKNVSACFKQYEQIRKDVSLKTFEQEIDRWHTFKAQCDASGEYKMYLADIYYDLHEYKQCQKLCEEVIREKGRDFNISMAERLSLMADIQLALTDSIESKKLESAKMKALDMIKKYPNWYAGYALYAQVLIIMDGPMQEIKKHLDKANQLEESALAFGLLAFQYYRVFQDYRKVLEFYGKALEINQVSTLRVRDVSAMAVESAIKLELWKTAAWILRSQKAMDVSVESTSQYQELKRQVDAQRKESLLVDGLYGGPRKPSQCFNNFEKIAQNVDVDTVEKAIKEWTFFKGQCEKTGEYDMYLGFIYALSNQWKDAQALLIKVIDEYGDRFDVSMAEAALTMFKIDMMCDAATGKELAQFMIEKYPDWHLGYLGYAIVLYNSNGSVGEIKEYLDKARNLEKRSAWPLLILAMVHYKLEDYEKTLMLYEKAIQMNRKTAAYWVSEAGIASAIKLGKCKLALEMLDYKKKVLGRECPKFQALRTKADSCQAKSNSKETIDLLSGSRI